MIKYTSVSDLLNTIRLNLWKIPNNIDLIVGVPRSGMFCAILVSEFLNKPVISIEDFLLGLEPSFGGRIKKTSNFKNILVLEDTAYTGRSILDAKQKCLNLGNANNYNFIFGCIYAEGKEATKKVDIYFENNYDPNTTLCHLYEWNILQHDEYVSKYLMFDMDGILCKEPPDERNTEEYIDYIQHATSMVIPSSMIGAIVTYRLNIYREITEKWLKDTGIQYKALYMVKANSWEERARMCSPAQYKAYVYKNATWALLFIESDKRQAQEIAKLSNKPVWCYEDGKMYQ